MEDVILLVEETTKEDDYGVISTSQNTKQVFCNVSSVSSTEWFEGGRNGLNPKFRFTMFAHDYSDEEIVEYNGKRYSVYRTFLKDADSIEIYVEKKKGTE